MTGRILIVFYLLLVINSVKAQELFVFTDPASNIPSGSVDVKLSDHYFSNDVVFDRPAHRVTLDAAAGVSKNFMISLGSSFSNMHTFKFQYESLFLNARYRFFSNDDVHRHFRMTTFLKASITKAPFHFDEVSLTGDKEGIALGVVATQLLNKLAFSASVAHTQLLDGSRFNKTFYSPQRVYQVMDYTLSAGYLLFPKEYTSYKQTNLNFYLEIIAQQALDKPVYYVDAAPAVQLIFASNTKLSFGYKVQVSGTAERMLRSSALITLEKVLLNTFSKKR